MAEEKDGLPTEPIELLAYFTRLLPLALKESKERGILKAERERQYRELLAAEILRLRADGFSTTLVSDVARGAESVAKAKYDRDCAEVLYDNAMEAINVYKKDIDVIREQINREWNNA